MVMAGGPAGRAGLPRPGRLARRMGPAVRLLTVDGHWRVREEPARPGRPRDWARTLDVEAGLVLETQCWPRRWLRLFAVWGDAPGSHMMDGHLTAWHTDCGPGEAHGWNLRTGWWPGPCLTMLCHTRPARDVWAEATGEAGKCG